MSENTPSPAPGALPPKPSEAAKVQPKKETVRINLPPKPTAAPTIKIPAPGAVAAATPAPAAPLAGSALAVTAPPLPTASTSAPAPTSAPRSAASRRAAPRPAAAPSGVSGVDVGLASVAALIAIAVVVRVFLVSQ